jgi:uncharacterized membrane protein HdeD (DUF308 family)
MLACEAASAGAALAATAVNAYWRHVMAAPHWIQALEGRPSLAYETGIWLTATGVVFSVLGVAAIVEPWIAGLALTVLVGWLLVAGSVTHVISAFTDGLGHAIWQATVGLAYGAAGVWFLMHPSMALGALTLLLAAVLIVEAGFEFYAYIWQREDDGSGWLLLNAVVTMMLAGLIWLRWPGTSVWAIGTLVGLNLLTNGFTRLMLGGAAYRIGRLTA